MNGVVTNRQIFFIILLTLTSGSLVQMPQKAIAASGTGAWVSIMILTLIFMLGVYFIASLNKKFEGKTIFEYSYFLVGKFISKLIGIIYASYFMFVLIILLRYVGTFIKSGFLPKTPVGVTILLFAITCLYMSYKGITNIGRLLEVYGTIFVFVTLAVHFAQFLVGDIMYIKPFFDPYQIKEYVVGIKDLLVPFLGIEILTIIPFGKVNNKRGIRYSVLAVLYVGIFYIIAVETSTMIVGINDILKYDASLVEALRETKLPSTIILERVDLLFLTVGIMGILSGLSILAFATVETASKLFYKTNKNKVFVIVGVLSYSASAFLISDKTSSYLFDSVLPIYGIFTAFVIPISLYILSRVKKYEG